MWAKTRCKSRDQLGGVYPCVGKTPRRRRSSGSDGVRCPFKWWKRTSVPGLGFRYWRSHQRRWWLLCMIASVLDDGLHPVGMQPIGQFRRRPVLELHDLFVWEFFHRIRTDSLQHEYCVAPCRCEGCGGRRPLRKIATSEGRSARTLNIRRRGILRIVQRVSGR